MPQAVPVPTTNGNPQVASGGFSLPEAGVSEEAACFQMKNLEFSAARYQDYSVLTQSVCHCKFMFFSGYSLSVMLNTLNAVTGWNWCMEDLLETGGQIFTLQRLVNVKYRVDRKDDPLPAVVFQPSKNGSRA